MVVELLHPVYTEGFGEAAPFIDDSADLASCFNNWPGKCFPLPGGTAGTCWAWSTLSGDPYFTTRKDLAISCENTYAECDEPCGGNWACH